MRDLILPEEPSFTYGDLLPAGTRLHEVSGVLTLDFPYIVTSLQATRSAQPGNPLVWMVDIKPLFSDDTLDNPTPQKRTQV